MILADDENIWNRPGVEGAALRPPRRVQGQSPCWGYGGEAPHPLTINCILKALDCLKFVAKNKASNIFPLIILFYFVQFWYLFEFAFSLYLVHAIVTAGLLYELPFTFSGFPLLSCLSKIPAKQSETPYKTWDTQNVSVYLDKRHGSNFNHANIRKSKGARSMYGCTV